MARGKSDFKVIIVGGSIAGLTLAHCLDKAGIDFVVLEARDEIAPQVGASIGILPNGARVFDQLGVWDDIEALIEPLSFLQVWTNANQLILESKHARLLESRMGYPTAFLDRQLVLRVLYDHLRQNDKVLVDKRAVSVQCSNHGVTVTCKDGSTYSGDMVAGADGVHSTIRNEMWRHIEKCGKQELIAKDMVALSAEYKCMFGISSPVPGLNIGTSHRAYNDDWSGLIIVGQAGRVFWFLFEKMDKRYWAPNIPRFSKSDADDFVNRFAKRHVAGNITFDALWATKITSTLVALEEAQYEHWSFDRFACLGDSIHKMTPNLGQGGNSAIESAAALSNSLCKLLEDTAGAKPSIDQVRQALQVYESKRQFRTAKICDTANTLTRLEAFVDLKHKIISKYIIPNSGDYLINLTCDNMIGATKLDFLPATPRSLQGTMPFDPNLGVGHEESRLSRALFALPLLGTLYFSRRILSETIGRTGPYIMSVMKAGAIATAHEPSIAVRSGFVGVSGIDKLLALYTTIFTPAISGIDPAQRLQMIGFMADLTPVQIIWTIEGLRRGNLMTFASLPTLFAIAYQFKGIGLVAPLYYFLHYVQSPQEKYHAADNRMVPKNFAKTVIPAVALGYVAPTIGMFLPFSIGTRQAINAVWQVFPVTTAILHRIFSKTVVDTTDEDCHKNVTADVPYLRYAYAFGGCVSAAAYVYLWTRSPFSMSKLFFSGVSSLTAPVTSFSDGIGRFLKYDQLFAFSSGLYWEILHFKDLKKAGKMKTSWWKIIGVLGGTTFAFGPGAAMSLGWAWREEVMAARRAVKA